VPRLTRNELLLLWIRVGSFDFGHIVVDYKKDAGAADHGDRSTS